MNFTDLNEEKIPQGLRPLINKYITMRNNGDNCVKQFLDVLSCSITHHKLWFLEHIPHFSGEIVKINKLFSNARKNEIFNSISNIFEEKSSTWILYRKERNLMLDLISRQQETVTNQTALMDIIYTLTRMLNIIKFCGVTIGSIAFPSILYFIKQNQDILLDKIFNISTSILSVYAEDICAEPALEQFIHPLSSHHLSQPEANPVPKYALAGFALCGASFFYGSWCFYQAQKKLEHQEKELTQRMYALIQDTSLPASQDMEKLDILIEPLIKAFHKQ